MADFKEQHMCIKFCFKPNTTATKTHKMLEIASGKETTSRTETFD
jgi:hypothetical protein